VTVITEGKGFLAWNATEHNAKQPRYGSPGWQGQGVAEPPTARGFMIQG